jgi:hypothetical protein
LNGMLNTLRRTPLIIVNNFKKQFRTGEYVICYEKR